MIKWGGLYEILRPQCACLLNVLVTPWGLAHGRALTDVLAAVPLILILFILVLVVIESSLAKFRLSGSPNFWGRLSHLGGGDDGLGSF